MESQHTFIGAPDYCTSTCDMLKKNICCKISTALFCCRLEVVAFVIGWLGVAYRIILIVTFGVLSSQLAEYDPNIFKLIFGIIIGYSSISLLASLMLLIGIFRRVHLLLIPYLCLEVFEILFLILAGLMRGYLMYFLSEERQIYWFVPLTLVAAFFFAYSWIVIINLYVVYSSQTYHMDDVNKNTGIKPIETD